MSIIYKLTQITYMRSSVESRHSHNCRCSREVRQRWKRRFQLFFILTPQLLTNAKKRQFKECLEDILKSCPSITEVLRLQEEINLYIKKKFKSDSGAQCPYMTLIEATELNPPKAPKARKPKEKAQKQTQRELSPLLVQNHQQEKDPNREDEFGRHKKSQIEPKSYFGKDQQVDINYSQAKQRIFTENSHQNSSQSTILSKHKKLIEENGKLYQIIDRLKNEKKEQQERQQTAYNQAMDIIRQLKQKNQSQEEIIKELKKNGQELLVCQNQLKKYLEKQQKYQKKLSQRDNSIFQLKDQILKSHKLFQSKIAALKKQKSLQYKKVHQSYQTDLQDAHTEIEVLKRTIRDLQSKKDDKKQETFNQKKKIQSIERNIKSLQVDNDQKDMEIAALKEQIRQKNKINRDRVQETRLNELLRQNFAKLQQKKCNRHHTCQHLRQLQHLNTSIQGLSKKLKQSHEQSSRNETIIRGHLCQIKQQSHQIQVLKRKIERLENLPRLRSDSSTKNIKQYQETKRINAEMNEIINQLRNEAFRRQFVIRDLIRKIDDMKSACHERQKEFDKKIEEMKSEKQKQMQKMKTNFMKYKLNTLLSDDF